MVDDGNSFFQDFLSDFFRFAGREGIGIGDSWFEDIISASTARILLGRCSNAAVVSSSDLSESSSVMLAACSFGGNTAREISDGLSKSEMVSSSSRIDNNSFRENLQKKKKEDLVIMHLALIVSVTSQWQQMLPRHFLSNL